MPATFLLYLVIINNLYYKVSKRNIKKIEKYLVRHHVSFHFCMYYPELGVDGNKCILREQFQKNNTIPYPTGSFPYHFMFGYNKGSGLTPYEHLIKEIGKYIRCSPDS